jgi:hypothetical protein
MHDPQTLALGVLSGGRQALHSGLQRQSSRFRRASARMSTPPYKNNYRERYGTESTG